MVSIDLSFFLWISRFFWMTKDPPPEYPSCIWNPNPHNDITFIKARITTSKLLLLLLWCTEAVSATTCTALCNYDNYSSILHHLIRLSIACVAILLFCCLNFALQRCVVHGVKYACFCEIKEGTTGKTKGSLMAGDRSVKLQNGGRIKKIWKAWVLV